MGMKRLLLIGFAFCALPAGAAQAQDRVSCLADAQLERDYCVREARQEGYSTQSCLSNYNSQAARCRTIVQPVRPINPQGPIGPIQRNKPIGRVSPPPNR
jgi:hypothetical protein